MEAAAVAEVAEAVAVAGINHFKKHTFMHSRFTFGILTILALAVMAVTAAVGLLLIPEQFQNDKFKLSLGAVMLSEFICWLFCAVIPAPGGEQTRGLFDGGSTIAAGLYLTTTLALACVAIMGFSFKFLLILHLVAFLVFLLITGLFLISGEATKRADDGGK